MAKLFPTLAIFICCGAHNAIAQHAEGVITYEVRINMHRNIPEDRQQMKQMIPEFSMEEAQLFFNAEESFYKPVEAEPDSETDMGQRPAMRMRPRNEIYLHQGESKLISLRKFMGKKYIIEDTLRMRPWKMETETKEIQGYLCRKATIVDDERKITVVAWYTDAMRPFLGPDNFNTLPGAVLLVDINDGERLINAKMIELRPPGENEIRIPKAKTKMTETEYRQMVKSQMERMRANGRNVIIRN